MLVNKSAWTSEGRTRTARSAASALPLPLPSGFLSLLVYAEHSEHLRRERMVVSTGDNTPCAMNAQNHGKDEQGIDWQSTLDTYLDIWHLRCMHRYLSKSVKCLRLSLSMCLGSKLVECDMFSLKGLTFVCVHAQVAVSPILFTRPARFADSSALHCSSLLCLSLGECMR